MIKARIRMVSGNYFDLTLMDNKVFEAFLYSLNLTQSSRFNFSSDDTGTQGIEIVVHKVESVEWKKVE